MFQQWAKAIATENNKNSLIVRMGPTGHYWLNLTYFLKDMDIRAVLVNPSHVKKSKELDDNSQTKNDGKDAKTIAKLVIDDR